jgi:hypothetical protein
MSVHESLVKYDNAILISNVGGKQKKGKKGGEKSVMLVLLSFHWRFNWKPEPTPLFDLGTSST